MKRAEHQRAQTSFFNILILQETCDISSLVFRQGKKIFVTNMSERSEFEFPLLPHLLIIVHVFGARL